MDASDVSKRGNLWGMPTETSSRTPDASARGGLLWIKLCFFRCEGVRVCACFLFRWQTVEAPTSERASPPLRATR